MLALSGYQHKGEKMVSILNNAYSTNSLYNNPYEKVTDSSETSKTSKSGTETKATSSSTRDTVTLSDDVAAARTREAMGLNPTGPLRLSDFKAAAEIQTEAVNQKLSSLMKEQGVANDQEITLSFDSKSKITIKENFSGKAKLEKALNEDKSFALSLKGLNANSGILNYTKDIQARVSSTNLAEFMNSDPDWSEITALASKYSELKSSANPLATLVNIGNSQTPYVFKYDPEVRQS